MNWASIQAAIQNWAVAGSGFSADHVIWTGQAGPRPALPWITLNVTSLPVIGRDWVDVVFNPLTVELTIDSVDAVNDQLDIADHGLLTGDGPVRLSTTGTLPTGLETATDYWVIKVDASTIQLADSFVHAIIDGTPLAIDDAGSGTHSIDDTTETCRAGEEIAHTARGMRELNIGIQCYGSSAVGDTNPIAVLNNVISAARRPLNVARFNAAKIGFLGNDAIVNIGTAMGSAKWDSRAAVNVRFSVAQESVEYGTFIETVEPPERQ